ELAARVGSPAAHGAIGEASAGVAVARDELDGGHPLQLELLEHVERQGRAAAHERVVEASGGGAEIGGCLAIADALGQREARREILDARAQLAAVADR